MKEGLARRFSRFSRFSCNFCSCFASRSFSFAWSSGGRGTVIFVSPTMPVEQKGSSGGASKERVSIFRKAWRRCSSTFGPVKLTPLLVPHPSPRLIANQGWLSENFLLCFFLCGTGALICKLSFFIDVYLILMMLFFNTEWAFDFFRR